MFLKFWKWFQLFKVKHLFRFFSLFFIDRKTWKKSTPEQAFVGNYFTEIIEFVGGNTFMESKLKTPPDPAENVFSSWHRSNLAVLFN